MIAVLGVYGGLADVSPMVGKLSEIIPNAMHASRLRNSLSELSVT